VLVVLARQAALGVHPRAHDAAQQRGDDNLLLTLGDLVQLQHRQPARPQQLLQRQVRVIVKQVGADQGGIDAPEERTNGWILLQIGVLRIGDGRVRQAGADLHHELVGRPLVRPVAAPHPVVGPPQQVVHLLREVRQEVAQVPQFQRGDAHLDVARADDLNLRRVALGGELGVVGHLGERAVLGVRIDHQHRGAVARAHQFLEDDAGQV